MDLTVEELKLEEEKKAAFLKLKIFEGLEIIRTDEETSQFVFSEADFKVILDRSEYYGIGIYSIQTFLDDEKFEFSEHTPYRKKATNPKWYKKAFEYFVKKDESLTYSASYRVSKKLIADKKVVDKKVEENTEESA